MHSANRSKSLGSFALPSAFAALRRRLSIPLGYTKLQAQEVQQLHARRPSLRLSGTCGQAFGQSSAKETQQPMLSPLESPMALTRNKPSGYPLRIARQSSLRTRSRELTHHQALQPQCKSYSASVSSCPRRYLRRSNHRNSSYSSSAYKEQLCERIEAKYNP